MTPPTLLYFRPSPVLDIVFNFHRTPVATSLNMMLLHRYAHMAVCTMFWLSLPLHIVSWLGMITDTPNGIMGEGAWAVRVQEKFRTLIAGIIFVAALTFSPRFPDIWLSLWGIAKLAWYVDSHPFYLSSEAVNMVFPLVYGLLVLALRIKLHVSVKSLIPMPRSANLRRRITASWQTSHRHENLGPETTDPEFSIANRRTRWRCVSTAKNLMMRGRRCWQPRPSSLPGN